MYHQLKIRDKFVDQIRQGIKTCEYRLATEEIRHFNLGDILILISNENPNKYVKVVINEKNIFSSWDDALSTNWKEGFSGLFADIEEVKKECYRFYSKTAVDNYGIIAFKISVVENYIKNSDVLLDTNIVIHRESNNNVSYEVLKLFKLLDELKINKIVDNSILKELEKYGDESAKKTMAMKINAYEKIPSIEVNDSNFNDVVKRYSLDENSVIDNQILFQVYSGRVNYLITNDKGILRKAKDLYMDGCVFSTYDFLKKIEELYPTLIDYPVLSIKLTRIGELSIGDVFFDSLREDYNGIEFNKWLKSKSNEKAYVFRNKGEIHGFLYLKIEEKNEDYSDIDPCLNPARRLKIGTFKIDSTGLRVGERFLKIVFDFALKSKVDEIYVTLFEDKRNDVKVLKELLMKWGFVIHGKKMSSGEIVLTKSLTKYDFNKDVRFNYPLTNPKCNYGVLPIDSSFHTDLFPDLFLKNEDMSLYIEKPCGYAIEKVYVCSYCNYTWNPGDLLMIYRMGERKPKRYTSVVTGYCILEEIQIANSLNELFDLCKNKSVFTTEELRDFYENMNYRVVIKVLYLNPLKTKVTLGDLEYTNIVAPGEGLRLTTSLSKQDFELIKKLGDE